MNADKLYKSGTGKIVRQLAGNKTQQFRLKDNRPSFVFQTKCMKNISCMQRMLPDGLTNVEDGKVWLSKTNEKSDGIVCNVIVLKKSNSKAEALKNISVKACEIGAKTQGMSWATSDSDYKDIKSISMNPFQVPIMSNVSPSDNGVSSIKLYYHYGPYNYGYIVKVDLNNTEQVGEMTKGPSVGNMYSNVHNTDKQEEIIKQTDSPESKIKFDAYTKLAGEGARFQCVRDNIDKVTNNTWFYIPGTHSIPKDPFNQTKKKVVKEPGLTFLELWGFWANPLGSKFNISNKELGESITGGFLKCESANKKTPKIPLQ